jgi:hypothetical protein
VEGPIRVLDVGCVLGELIRELRPVPGLSVLAAGVLGP